MNSKLLKFNSLQYLRGLCAIAVVLFHVEVGINKYWEAQNHISFFSWGSIGVPMFFCLSGFVIAYSGYLKPKKLLDFLFIRLARVYPVYLFTAVLFVAIIFLVPQKAFNISPNLSIEELINTLFFGFGKSENGYIYVGWTLFYEMGFYIVFSPLSYKFAEFVKSKVFCYAISIGIVSCSIINLPFISCFLLGISVFMIISKPINQSYFSIPYCILFISIAIEFFCYPIGFFCGTLLFCLINLEKKKKSIFIFKPFLKICDSSYSIYLIQVITISASLKVSKLITQSFFISENQYFIFYLFSTIIALFSTTVIGIFMRKFIEKPSYQYLINSKLHTSLMN
tara:strand:+ start:438 stop:1454 length:1017 start_codon:yes stop_codon:yes gene_type:complete